MSHSITRNERLDQIVLKAKVKHPDIVRFIDRAAEIVQTGKLLAPGDGVAGATETAVRYPLAEATGSNGATYVIYVIEWNEPGPSQPPPDHRHKLGCHCPFYQKGQGRRPHINGQPICKHILAVLIERKLERDLAKYAEAAKRPNTAHAARNKAMTARKTAGSGQAISRVQLEDANYRKTAEYARRGQLFNAALNEEAFQEMQQKQNYDDRKRPF